MSSYAVPSSAPSPSPTASGGAGERVSLRRLLWVAPLAIVGAIAVNLLIWLLAESLFTIPAGFVPMDPPPIVSFSAFGVLAATAVFAVLARFSRRPVTVFLWVSLVALVLSLVPNVLLLLDSSNAPFPEMSVPGMWALMLMHVTTAVVAVWALTTLTRESSR